MRVYIRDYNYDDPTRYSGFKGPVVRHTEMQDDFRGGEREHVFWTAELDCSFEDFIRQYGRAQISFIPEERRCPGFEDIEFFVYMTQYASFSQRG